MNTCGCALVRRALHGGALGAMMQAIISMSHPMRCLKVVIEAKHQKIFCCIIDNFWRSFVKQAMCGA